MKRVRVLKTVSAIYVTAALLFICMVDSNMVYGFLSVVSIMGAAGYYDVAKQREHEINNELNNNNHD